MRGPRACLGALHPCPHATVTWSPWEGGTRQYLTTFSAILAIEIYTQIMITDNAYYIEKTVGSL